jgi:hypothetical protein
LKAGKGNGAFVPPLVYLFVGDIGVFVEEAPREVGLCFCAELHKPGLVVGMCWGYRGEFVLAEAKECRDEEL